MITLYDELADKFNWVKVIGPNEQIEKMKKSQIFPLDK